MGKYSYLCTTVLRKLRRWVPLSFLYAKWRKVGLALWQEVSYGCGYVPGPQSDWFNTGGYFFLFPLTNAGYLRTVVNMKKNMALVKKKSLIHIDRATIFLWHPAQGGKLKCWVNAMLPSGCKLYKRRESDKLLSCHFPIDQLLKHDVNENM